MLLGNVHHTCGFYVSWFGRIYKQQLLSTYYQKTSPQTPLCMNEQTTFHFVYVSSNTLQTNKQQTNNTILSLQ